MLKKKKKKKPNKTIVTFSICNPMGYIFKLSHRFFCLEWWITL